VERHWRKKYREKARSLQQALKSALIRLTVLQEKIDRLEEQIESNFSDEEEVEPEENVEEEVDKNVIVEEEKQNFSPELKLFLESVQQNSSRSSFRFSLQFKTVCKRIFCKLGSSSWESLRKMFTYVPSSDVLSRLPLRDETFFATVFNEEEIQRSASSISSFYTRIGFSLLWFYLSSFLKK